jgi:hypothetical protein
MFCAMIARARPDCVSAGSAFSAVPIDARTSGGKSVDVRTINCNTLSKNEGNIPDSILTSDPRLPIYDRRLRIYDCDLRMRIDDLQSGAWNRPLKTSNQQTIWNSASNVMTRGGVVGEGR